MPDDVLTAEALSIITPFTTTVEPLSVAVRSANWLILNANWAATSWVELKVEDPVDDAKTVAEDVEVPIATPIEFKSAVTRDPFNAIVNWSRFRDVLCCHSGYPALFPSPLSGQETTIEAPSEAERALHPEFWDKTPVAASPLDVSFTIILVNCWLQPLVSDTVISYVPAVVRFSIVIDELAGSCEVLRVNPPPCLETVTV